MMICPQCREPVSVLLFVKTAHGMAQMCRVCRDHGVIPHKMPLVQKIGVVLMFICIIAILVIVAALLFNKYK